MQANGIPSVIYYVKPLHQQVAYSKFPIAPGGLPVSESLPGRILCLPMHPYLTDEDIERIVGAVAQFHGKAELKRAAG